MSSTMTTVPVNSSNTTSSSTTSSSSSSSSSNNIRHHSSSSGGGGVMNNFNHHPHHQHNDQQNAINKQSNNNNNIGLRNSSTMMANSNLSTNSNHHHNQHNSNNQQQQQQIIPFTNLTNNHQQNLIEIKSKFDAEFRRFSIQRTEITNLEDFVKLIEHFHNLFTIPFCLFYTDPIHGDLLPINNDKNFALAIASAKPLLRLIVQRKGESIDYLNNYGKKKNFLGNILPSSVSSSSSAKNRLAISAPEDFRQVSSIIDVDIVPETCRRVRLVKHGSDKPLGFYIRDGSSFRITEHGFEKVPGIFISRLVPGGLAESTGLLAVNDEVLEVNGIEVNGKSLDQVTDMMVANSSNLIITIRPANQRAHAAGHHNTLSSSYSSNTISNYSHHHQHPNHPNQLHHHQHHPTGSTAASLGINQSMTIDTRHPQHHYLNHQYYNHPHYHGTNNSNVSHHYTNSLERSGHRSKVSQVDYYGNMYNGPSTSNNNNNNRKPDQPHQFLSSASATAAATTTTATTFRPHASTSSAYQLHAHSNYSHHPHHHHHQRTHSTGMIQVIENDDDNVDDDDDDEDEVRDHFNAELTTNSSTANNNNNVTITTIATAITTSPPQIFTTNVYTLSSNPTMVECITIGPSTSTSKSLNNNNNNITNGTINIGHQSPSPYVRKRNNSDVNNTTTTMSINNQQQQTPQHYYFNNKNNNNTNGTHQQQTANNNNLTSTTQSTNDSDIVTL